MLRVGGVLFGLIGAALFSAAASAQRGGGSPDTNELALDWARGRYASPILCEFDGEVRRGVRRVSIIPGPRHVQPPVDRVLFIDMEVEKASRCFDELGAALPNLVGSIEIRLPGPSRRDTARHDFGVALRRRKGFEFAIPSGELRWEAVGGTSARIVRFRGGKVRLHVLDPSSDSARLLADFSSPRKLLLEFATGEGEEFRIPLFLISER